MSIASPASTAPWPAELIELDELISVAEAANLCRRWTGRPTNPATVWRWSRKGRLGIILPHVRIGRAVMSTEAALRWFIAETTAAEINAHAGDDPPQARRTPRPTPDALAAALRAEGL